MKATMLRGLTFLLLAFFPPTLLASSPLAHPVYNYCWSDTKSEMVCLKDHQGSVRVLMFMTGWCSVCNKRIEEITRRYPAFQNRNVVFYSNMIQAWNPQSNPDPAFLDEWRRQHSIPRKIHVVSTPKEDLKDFSHQIQIPYFVVIDQSGNVTMQEAGCQISEVFAEVEKLLEPFPDKIP